MDGRLSKPPAIVNATGVKVKMLKLTMSSVPELTEQMRCCHSDCSQLQRLAGWPLDDHRTMLPVYPWQGTVWDRCLMMQVRGKSGVDSSSRRTLAAVSRDEKSLTKHARRLAQSRPHQVAFHKILLATLSLPLHYYHRQETCCCNARVLHSEWWQVLMDCRLIFVRPHADCR